MSDTFKSRGGIPFPAEMAAATPGDGILTAWSPWAVSLRISSS
jgi:hypothetical protein